MVWMRIVIFLTLLALKDSTIITFYDVEVANYLLHPLLPQVKFTY